MTFDMGGTSTDVALCPGRIPSSAESVVAELPLHLPMIDIHTVGAGGGSVAFIDSGGALRVGPRSAGAVPGPAAYGRGGTEPTVTDANLVLGRLETSAFLGGQGDVGLDRAAATDALRRLGNSLGMTPEQTALGVIRVANATMERALRKVSVERGYDPREFTLLPFGGAGPLHACDLADSLGMRRVLVPLFPGVLSAYGMLVAPVSTDASQSLLVTADELVSEPGHLKTALESLKVRVGEVLRRERVGQPTLSAALDMRYRGQSYELSVPLELPAGADELARGVQAFHALHEQRYGYAMPGERVEVVTVRMRGASPSASMALPQIASGGEDAALAYTGKRNIWFDGGGSSETLVYARSRLLAGNRIVGPAVIEQYDSTTLLGLGWVALVDTWGNLVMERKP
jgi:N-methylhydantoinase A